jgi:hypothetical protein
VLRTILRTSEGLNTQGMEELYQKGLRQLYRSRDIVRVVKTRCHQCESAAQLAEENTQRILMGKLLGKRKL